MISPADSELADKEQMWLWRWNQQRLDLANSGSLKTASPWVPRLQSSRSDVDHFVIRDEVLRCATWEGDRISCRQQSRASCSWISPIFRRLLCIWRSAADRADPAASRASADQANVAPALPTLCRRVVKSLSASQDSADQVGAEHGSLPLPYRATTGVPDRDERTWDEVLPVQATICQGQVSFWSPERRGC